VAGAVAGGIAGRVILRGRRVDPEANELLSALPPEDLGAVSSFDGTAIAVRAAGEVGSPMIVFVHGFSLDLTTWHYQWRDLSHRFRCVLFDLRAHGRSGPAVSGDLSVQAMGRDLEAVLDRVAVEGPVVLVGHSLGAMAIFAIAERRPELFGTTIIGVAIVGSAAFDLLRGAMGSIAGALRPRFGSLAQAARRVDRLRRLVVARPGDLAGFIARVTQFGPDASPHLVQYVVSLAARAPTEVWTDGLAGLLEMDLRHALEHVRVPAVVAVGEHDRVTPPASAVRLADALPFGRLEVVAGAGHLAMLERHDAVNELLARFADEAFASAAPGRTARRAKRAKA
jgi:pimeloyl-ACP methyl ester carboxylesterase